MCSHLFFSCHNYFKIISSCRKVKTALVFTSSKITFLKLSKFVYTCMYRVSQRCSPNFFKCQFWPILNRNIKQIAAAPNIMVSILKIFHIKKPKLTFVPNLVNLNSSETPYICKFCQFPTFYLIKYEN